MNIFAGLDRLNRRNIRTIGIGMGVAASLTLMANAGAAIDLTAAKTAAGPWEIALQNTERRCGMQLRLDQQTGAGHMIGMPAGCRRALPILMDVGGWNVAPGQALELGDKAGTPILSFAPGEAESLFAMGPEGETYELIPTGRQRYAQANPNSTLRPIPAPGIRTLTTAPAAQAPNAAAPPVPAAQQPQQGQQRQSAQAPRSTAAAPGGPTTALKPFSGRPADLPGRYVILRESGKDVGCMLTFSDQSARSPGGSAKAQLAPACRDNGIVVFDPLGWQLDRGRLALTARKGHKAMFEHHEDGSWWKDPKEGGQPLGIRKMMR